MAVYNSFKIEHEQGGATDTFNIDLGSSNQLLTSFIAFNEDTANIGLRFKVENSTTSGGAGALLQLGFTSNTPIYSPFTFDIVRRDKYLLLPNQFLYFTTSTDVGVNQTFYLTTTTLSPTPSIIDKIDSVVTPITTSGATTILTAPAPGVKYNVKSVYIYQNSTSANAGSILVNTTPVANGVDLALSQSFLMNNSDILLDETQTLNFQCINSVSTVYATVTYTVIS